MQEKTNSIASDFLDVNEVKKEIASNIENFLKNHIREGALGRSQNMAARRDSWNPLIMKNQDVSILSKQSPKV